MNHTKRRRKNWKRVITVILLLYVLRLLGIVSLDLGITRITNLRDFGGVSSGSITSLDNYIEIDWGTEQIVQKGISDSIKVEITSFNEWDWTLWLPFYKSYESNVRGTIINSAGYTLGTIEFSDKIDFIGFWGRGGIVKKLREKYSQDIFNYLQSRTKSNHNSLLDPISCQDQMKLSISYMFPITDSMLFGTPKETYYCLKNGQVTWNDTIYFPSYKLEVDSLVSYETTAFDRTQNLIEQKRYYHNGQVFFKACYYANDSRHRSFFITPRSEGETGSSSDYAEINEIVLLDWAGDTVYYKVRGIYNEKYPPR